MTPFDLIVWFVTGALTVIAGILLVNLPLFPLLGRGKTWSGAWPRVSVLVPARDEAAVIGETVRTLATQDYPDLEVIVLDDHSTDGTGDLARGRVKIGRVIRWRRLRPAIF